jgi:tetratricopeptide (TPR) repeat protein
MQSFESTAGRYPIIELKTEERRQYARVPAPKGVLVGWKTAGRRTVSRIGTIGLGGLFACTATPPAAGSTIELVFDLSTGEVRARAEVRSSAPGRGMGIKFVQMRPEDRVRLNHFLSQRLGPVAASHHESRRAVSGEPSCKPSSGSGEPANPSTFECEVKQLLEVAEKGSYYQLLSVTSESPDDQIRQNFYALARKFHPDHHMEQHGLDESLKRLMGVLTEAYKTLKDEQKRIVYDKRLAASGNFSLHRGKTATQYTIDECAGRASECLSAKNFVGSINWLRKCVEAAPDEAKYHAALARSLSTVIAYRNEAIEHFQKAIELDPWNVDVYFQWAELYEEMQLPWRARVLYSKILEINPEEPKARDRIAQLNSRQ